MWLRRGHQGEGQMLCNCQFLAWSVLGRSPARRPTRGDLPPQAEPLARVCCQTPSTTNLIFRNLGERGGEIPGPMKLNHKLIT